MYLVRLVFYSRNCVNFGENRIAMIKSMLQSCSEYSVTSGFTGGLVFNERVFMQVMEGPRDLVSKNLKTLMSDKRQDDITVLATYAIDTRAFTGWSVGYAAKTVDAELVYMKYGLGVDLDPSKMSPGAIEAFVTDYCRTESMYVQHSEGFERSGKPTVQTAATAAAVERIKVSVRG